MIYQVKTKIQKKIQNRKNHRINKTNFKTRKLIKLSLKIKILKIHNNKKINNHNKLRDFILSND